MEYCIQHMNTQSSCPPQSLVTFQISVCARKDTHNTVYVYISLKLEIQ